MRKFWYTSMAFLLLVAFGCGDQGDEVEPIVDEDNEYLIYSQYISGSFLENVVLNESLNSDFVLQATTAEVVNQAIDNNPFQDANLLRNLISLDKTTRELTDEFTPKFKEVTLITSEERDQIFIPTRTDEENWQEFTNTYGEEWIYTFSSIGFSDGNTKAVFCIVGESLAGTFATAILMTKVNGVWLYEDFESLTSFE